MKSQMDSVEKTPEPEKAKFWLKEFELLRGEVEQRSQEQRAMERNVVILTAGIFTFLVSKDLNPAEIATPALLAIGWLIPPVVSLLALSRWLDSLRMIKLLAIYLGKLEAQLAGPGGGWESTLKEIRGRRQMKFCSLGSILFWIFITGAPAGIAAYRIKTSVDDYRETDPSWPMFQFNLVYAVLIIAASVAIWGGFAWLLIYRAGLNTSAEQDEV